MNLKSVSGVAYRVKDMDVTLDFYQKLGFRAGKKDGLSGAVYLNWFWLEFFCTERQPEDEIPPVEPRADLTHEALLYLSVADLSEMVLELRERGLFPTPEVLNQPKGRRESAILDPDGYRLVFFEKN